MTFIRNIRQKFCKHYFVFDADSCLYNENKEKYHSRYLNALNMVKFCTITGF